MKIISIAVAALIALPATALALAFETLGNAPMIMQSGWPEGVLAVINQKSRVYSLWCNGVDVSFYRGDARALNEALQKFAAVKAPERKLVLLPGRGSTRTFSGNAVDFGWTLCVMSKQAVLTVYIDSEKPRVPIDRQKTQRWVSELDNDSFRTRQAASRELEKLGEAAKPLLREALKDRPSLEARLRIEALLAKLTGLDAGDLEIPAGVKFAIEKGKDEPGGEKEVKKRIAILKDLEELKKARDK